VALTNESLFHTTRLSYRERTEASSSRTSCNAGGRLSQRATRSHGHGEKAQTELFLHKGATPSPRTPSPPHRRPTTDGCAYDAGRPPPRRGSWPPPSPPLVAVRALPRLHRVLFRTLGLAPATRPARVVARPAMQARVVQRPADAGGGSVELQPPVMAGGHGGGRGRDGGGGARRGARRAAPLDARGARGSGR